MNKLLAGCIAEYIGTFALIFFGAGSIILTAAHPGSGANLTTVALAHGIALIVFVSGTMYISGGQLNPAVSLALVAIGKQSPKRAGAFIVAQLLAAACGAGALVALLGGEVANSMAANLGATKGSLTASGATGAVFGLEAVMTFALMFAILSCVADERAHKLGGFAVGLTVMMCIVLAGPLTGASMNPARTFGPALYGHWDMVWVYWGAHVAGAVAAAFVYKFMTSLYAKG